MNDKTIVIITTSAHPCACYLARQLKDVTHNLHIFNQTRLALSPYSWKYHYRLLKNHGVLLAIDNLLFNILSLTKLLANKIVRKSGCSQENPKASNSELPPALRPDPDLRAENWLRWHDVNNINSNEAKNKIAALKPDCLLLAGAPIIGAEVIGLTRDLCLNPHCGITPQFCGSAPQVWACFEGNWDAIGFTIHHVEPKVDSGPIIYQERLDWKPSLTFEQLWYELAQRMYDHLAVVAKDYCLGKALPKKEQSHCRVRPPAGLLVRAVANLRKWEYAKRVL